ncbi:SDR family NAD(P)-dependent oxidoreductase [Cupriavidus neocaledonicus]|uniref:7-alpha-hydroxysteroid dehydrogenase n=1 Tax=Cupriavidus neocaledonicus TaxID=1040979 RepID=A0A375HR02_9BURK|nr:SDR family oxidoreductase [Cupriavidus neocaledonicus]SOZ40079.1 7-alpha-hydroxysteroid dehydrogenase [Cupriavidus neocaledonicus]SPD60579.1 7-alpha-hydroxysteroid dehydrogenase [Cupriavidus neocaledonicus]
MTRVLEGRTALVTGGAGGIGAASALALLRDGAAVVLMGRRREALEAARRSLREQVAGATVEISVGDACREDDVQAALQQAWALGRRLDMVVATVGGGGFRPLLMHDAASLMAELELNIASAFLAIRHASPLMAPHGGAIVCISSNAARMTCRWLSAYCAAKAGLDALVRAAAEELAGCGIRVNAVRPGLTRSGASGPLFDNPAVLGKFVAQMPLGRAGEPDDIAGAVRYLAGPESGWVTGQSLAVDGGSELRGNPLLDEAVAAVYGEAALRAVLAGSIPDAT